MVHTTLLSLAGHLLDLLLPQGTFATHQPVPTDFNIKTVPTFFYGRWRLTCRLLRTSDRETMACIRAYGETVPRYH